MLSREKKCVIDFDIALIVIIGKFRIQEVVIRRARPVRRRKELQEFEHDRVETVGRHAVSRKGIAYIAASCVRIENRGAAGEVAFPHWRGRNRKNPRKSFSHARALKIAKE